VDSGRSSDIAIELAKKYKYIFVDEYQDVNPVQQRIIDLLSGKAKVFVVGDVKQSIYAWRGADCGLFVERLNNAKQDEIKSRVDLNENFRSKPGILKFVNEVFSKIMTESVAAIDYDENAALKPFKDSHEAGKPDVELLIVDEEFKDDSEDENDNENETISSDSINRRAITVAQRIKELVEEEKFQIFDKKANCSRPCKYSDIVILTRSFSQRANNYVQILRLANIPVISDSSTGYFATTEISDMLSLLRVLDNPQQDIPLAAVLRSPLFGLSDSKLLKIRAHKNEKLTFYSLLESFAAQDNQIKDVLLKIDDWRTLARQTSLADLIWKIYSQTGYLSFVSAMPGGAQRHANLLKLHQRAIQFENFASNFNIISLSRFVDFLQKLLDSGGDWAPAEPDSSASNAVRIMSVHKSKGLEFPIVILAETGREFQTSINSKDYITDGQNTIGFKIIEHASKTKLPSLTWQVIKEKQRKLNLAEEMRILYVAMTRAKDKLIISGSAETKTSIKLISNIAICDSQKLPAWIIENAKCELDWILLSLAHYKKLTNHFKPIVNVEGKDSDLFDIKICDMLEISRLSTKLIKKHPASRYENVESLPDEALQGNIVKELNWNYPFIDCASIKAKQSVTSIVHGEMEFAEPDYKFLFESFDTKDKTDSLLIGSATHLVIKKIDVEKEINEKSIGMTIDDLISKGCITAQLAKKINISSIMDFFKSDLGKVLADKKNKIMREWPFTYAASVSDLYPDKKKCEDEKIIIQGIIDMLVQTPDRVVVIDFKTDKVKSGEIQKRAENYISQIKWYCKAAGAILGTEKIEGWLYFLNAGESVRAY
jgi:ATP-dependent helicase/nuclease subunit A